VNQDKLRAELRNSLPRAAEAAKRQRGAAIRLFCIECMGGSIRDAAACQEKDCFLWPHAYRAQRGVVLPEKAP
jgi:hypothetical protein